MSRRGRVISTQALQEIDGKGHYLGEKLARTEHRHRVLNLIRNGATSHQVVDVLAEDGIETTPSAVTQLVKNYLTKVHTEDALTLEQMRALENERLDSLWRSLSAQLRNADGTVNLKVADRLTRLSERRSRMNGIEAAQRHEVYIANGLEALGLEAEHVERSRQAWLDAGPDDSIPEAEVVTDG